MKHFLTSLVCVFAIACGGTQKSQPDLAEAPAGNPDLAQVSPPTGAAPPCSQEIALACPDGVDGCTTGKTDVHVCVSTTAQAGPSCAQEIALACPDGEIDACLVTPPAAANHICVRR